MVYVTRDDGVEILSLSTRCYNCLRRTGIDTVGQFLDYPADEWENIRSLGKKGALEIMETAKQLRNGGGSFVLADAEEKPASSLVQDQKPAAVRRLLTVPVEELQLSVRAHNCLINHGIRSTAQLAEATEASLLQIKNMGKKSAQEVMKKLESFWVESEEQSEAVDSAPTEKDDDTLMGPLTKLTDLTVGDVIREVAACRNEHPEAGEDEIIAGLCQRNVIRRAVRRGLLRLLEQHEDGATIHGLLEQLPRGTTEAVLEGLLLEMEQKKLVVRHDDLILRRYPTVMEFAEHLPKDHKREILLLRLKGVTLEEIGQTYGVTRERVRQITQQLLSKHPRLQEDGYQYLFDHYEFSREEFYLAFEEPQETYNYLEMMRPKRQRLPIREMLSDSNVSAAYRRKAEKAIYKNYITINGVRVEKSRPELVRYAVQAFCQEVTSMDDFAKQYSQFLEDVGLEDEESLKINCRTYENALSVCDYVLWNQRHRFRYYPIWEREYEPLLAALDLEHYEDAELSTLKLLRDNLALMEEYDIRDEYELHNLLKKIWPDGAEGQRVTFKKMPTIEIGSSDRDQQVLDLLAQHSPISNVELAEKYEEQYGAKAATALANYFGCIDCYFHSGVYRMDLPPLSQERHEQMLRVLTEDFYRIAEIKRLYLREFPGAAASDINAFVLKRLGFRTYTDYVIRNCFSSAAEYFRRLLTEQDITDMRSRSRQMTYIVAYGSELYELKAKREIIEFAPEQYIHIRRLRSNGVTDADLESYCLAVEEFIPQGEYFTIHSLKEDGFTHPLDEIGFDDWFYASLLAEDRGSFSYRRMGGTKLFRRGQGNLQLVEFLHWLIAQESRIDIYDLREKLAQRYGMTFQVEKLITVIRGSDMYYDAIMQAVYIDYDHYFEEI